MRRLLPHARVGIRAFPGIVIEDSWIQFNRSYHFRPGTPTALVVGSAIEFDEGARKLANRARLEGYCTEIGRMLASYGFNLINGACPGLPDAAMAAFNTSSRKTVSVGLSAYDSPRAHLAPKGFAPNGFPLSADITVFCGTGFELLNVLNTLCADLLIVVGGGVGTLLEAATAVEQELPVICLEPSGGISEELRTLLARYIASFKSFDVRLCSDLEDIQQHLNDFRDAFTHRSAQTRLTRLIQEIERAEHDRNARVQFEISPDLKSIRYKYRDVSLELLEPVLMTDRVRISRIPNGGEQILAALVTRPRVYTFQQVEVVASPSVSSVIWGPNIDTLLMLKSLVAGQSQWAGKRVLEIGSGSGLISLWLASMSNDISVLGIDADPAAVLCAEWNCSNQGLFDRCKFQVGVYEDGVSGSYDLIVCTPPYLPPKDSTVLGPITFSGCKLLNSLCENYGQNLAEGGICLFTASSASFLDTQFRENCERLSSDGSLRIVESKRIPLNVYDVLDDTEWLTFLESKGGIFRRPDEDYTWWHDVKVIQLRN